MLASWELAPRIRGLEEGTNHEQLPLIFLAQIADQLGVAIPELFAHATSAPIVPTTDDRTVEAALHLAPGLVATSTLATALGWMLERLRAALEALEPRLRSGGARLHRNGWQQCAIRPRTEHLSDDQQQALHQIGPRNRGLTHLTARVLLTATRGELDDRWLKTATNSQRVALQSLLKQGVLVTVPEKRRSCSPPTQSTTWNQNSPSPPRSAMPVPSSGHRRTTRSPWRH